MRNLALALRRGSESNVSTDELQDLFAFILTNLEEINASVDRTAQAWEKRGYWLKADRFRLDWEWCRMCAHLLVDCLGNQDMEGSRAALPALVQAAMKVQIPKKMRDAQPWRGAWSAYVARPPRTRSPGA
jgi:hypothetical protein